MWGPRQQAVIGGDPLAHLALECGSAGKFRSPANAGHPRLPEALVPTCVLVILQRKRDWLP